MILIKNILRLAKAKNSKSKIVKIIKNKNRGAIIEDGIRVLGDPTKIKLADGCFIEEGVLFDLQGGGEIILGEQCSIRAGAILSTYGGIIRFGKFSGVQHYSVIYGHGGLEVGDYVRIAAHCVIIPANHSTVLNGIPIHHQPETKHGIRIGNDVWIGAGATILDGVKLGNGVVVAAGAVVNKAVESDCIVGGVPAKVLGKRKSKDHALSP